MNPHPVRRSLALLLAVTAAACFLPPGRADEGGKTVHSLHIVPADASFYSASLRNREQLDIVLKSKAFAKLTELPLYKIGMQQLQAQLAKPDPQLAQILKLYALPENEQLVALLGEMMGTEVFAYGGSGMNALLELLGKVNYANQMGQVNMLMKLRQQGEGANPAILQARIYLNLLRDNLKLIQTPEFVMGFHVANKDGAETQLKRLEDAIEPLLDRVPLLKGRLQKAKVKGQTVLSLTLDGKMVPWDKTPIRDVEEKDGEYDGLIKTLTNLKLNISLGVRDNYVLLAIGESLDSLDRLGGKGEKLADRMEMKPLRAAESKPITSVAYLSKALLTKLMTSPEDVDGMTEVLKGLLQSAPLQDAQRKRLAKDIEGMGNDFKAILPQAGAMMSFAFMTDRGEEGFSYLHTKVPGKIPEAPLTLLNHVGGNPIAAFVGRTAYEPSRYQTMVKWLKVIHAHAEEFALPQLPEGAKGMYDQIGKIVYPLLNRLDEVTGKMFLPALADGQMALVLDGKWSSRRWHMMAPNTPTAMPLPELGIVLGVTDAALLSKAMAEYRKIVNDALAAARELSQGMMPEIRIPPPENEESKGGTLYFYPIPAALGLDKQVRPTVGLGEKVAVLAFSKDHAERLLGSNKLKIDGGPLADASRPLVGATVFSWVGLIDTATPWIEFGIKSAAPADGGAKRGPQVGEILEQVQVVLEILKCYKGSSSASFIEGGVVVTHSVSVIRDLK